MNEQRRYLDRVDRVRAQVRATVPEGSRVLVVSRGDEALLRLGRREGGHFPQSPTGLYAGHYPADGAAAAAHLEELREAGGQYLVIPAEASWWLEHYPELREALEAQAELVGADPEAARIFKLPPASRSAARRSTAAFAPPSPRRRRRSAGGRLPIPAKRRGAKRVLQICHNHPRLRPGGAEVYAYELHRHLRDSSQWEPVFLARSGPPHSPEAMPEDGTRISPVKGEGLEFLLHTEGLDFDWMFGTMRHRKDLYTEDLRGFLLALRPDVVHFQHTLFIGYDAIREVRRTLPGVPIIYTLHEFLPICHNKGQMVRTLDRSLCGEASPRRCAECFPGIEPDQFLLRERFIRAALDLVDLFVAPSATLRERYIEWGIPRERILLEDYGRVPPPPAEAERPAPHETLGIFGQVNPYKGFDLLLRAMQALGPEAPKLRLHGANLDLQEHGFRDEIAALLAATPGVTDVGPYPPERAGEMMAAVDWVVVPSIWWENSPLVIQEAFAAGRPVICSDVGGMAEKVTDGVSGLHFQVGDPESLAATIRRAVTTPGLWEQLREGIPPAHPMTDHAAVLTSTYESLLQPELHQILAPGGRKSDAVRSEDPEAVA
jgi:glycosyltransferase involved in cell wall biosynthesis